MTTAITIIIIFTHETATDVYTTTEKKCNNNVLLLILSGMDQLEDICFGLLKKYLRSQKIKLKHLQLEKKSKLIHLSNASITSVFFADICHTTWICSFSDYKWQQLPNVIVMKP